MELSNLVDQRHVEALFRGWGPEDSDAVAKLQEEKSGGAAAVWGDGGRITRQLTTPGLRERSEAVPCLTGRSV